MRKSAKCPWCYSQMVEHVEQEPSNAKEGSYKGWFIGIYWLKCPICESSGPRYTKDKNNKMIFLPSKNGV